MMLSENVIIAIIGAFSALSAGVLIEIVKRVLSKAQDEKDREAAREEALSTGLRTDLLRKAEELLYIKEQLEAIEREKNNWRDEYYRLYEEYVTLRILAKEVFIKNGLTQEDIDDILPNRRKMVNLNDKRLE